MGWRVRRATMGSVRANRTMATGCRRRVDDAGSSRTNSTWGGHVPGRRWRARGHPRVVSRPRARRASTTSAVTLRCTRTGSGGRPWQRSVFHIAPRTGDLPTQAVRGVAGVAVVGWGCGESCSGGQYSHSPSALQKRPSTSPCLRHRLIVVRLAPSNWPSCRVWLWLGLNGCVATAPAQRLPTIGWPGPPTDGSPIGSSGPGRMVAPTWCLSRSRSWPMGRDHPAAPASPGSLRERVRPGQQGT